MVVRVEGRFSYTFVFMASLTANNKKNTRVITLKKISCFNLIFLEL